MGRERSAIVNLIERDIGNLKSSSCGWSGTLPARVGRRVRVRRRALAKLLINAMRIRFRELRRSCDESRSAGRDERLCLRAPFRLHSRACPIVRPSTQWIVRRC
jgi:hypothetical protein